MKRLLLFITALFMTAGCSFHGNPQRWPESHPVSGAAALQGKTAFETSPYYPRLDFTTGK